MIAFFQRLLWDESAFERYLRAAVFALGQAAQQGILPGGKLGWYVGLLAQAGALLVPAGEKNAG